MEAPTLPGASHTPLNLNDPDDPRYIISFAASQEREFKQFFDQYGFVVIRDVLSSDECKATIEGIWRYLETRGWIHPEFRASTSLRIDRSDPSTWTSDRWPSMSNEGILGSAVVFEREALLNRQNPLIYSVHRALLSRSDLMINHDRYGLFRPTQHVVFPDGSTHDFPSWKTMRNLHFDMNPWDYIFSSPLEYSSFIDASLNRLRYSRRSDFITENNFVIPSEINVQGLINLIDNEAQDGGFHLVPGFKSRLASWVESTQHRLRHRYGKHQTFVVIPEDEKENAEAVRITCRAGSMVVWDQRTLHGSAPNASEKMRMAQFFKVFPAVKAETEEAKARKKARKEVVEAELRRLGMEAEVTPLGRKLFGLDDWNPEEKS